MCHHLVIDKASVLPSTHTAADINNNPNSIPDLTYSTTLTNPQQNCMDYLVVSELTD